VVLIFTNVKCFYRRKREVSNVLLVVPVVT